MAEPPAFDPERTWRAVEDRLERESDPRRRALLAQVRDHMRSRWSTSPAGG